MLFSSEAESTLLLILELFACLPAIIPYHLEPCRLPDAKLAYCSNCFALPHFADMVYLFKAFYFNNWSKQCNNVFPFFFSKTTVKLLFEFDQVKTFVKGSQPYRTQSGFSEAEWLCKTLNWCWGWSSQTALEAIIKQQLEKLPHQSGAQWVRGWAGRAQFVRRISFASEDIVLGGLDISTSNLPPDLSFHDIINATYVHCTTAMVKILQSLLR